MSSACKTYIRESDSFGQPILLNFNKKGNTHNTVFGGVISIVTKAILFAYFVIHVEKLVNFGDDKITRTNSSLSFEE